MATLNSPGVSVSVIDESFYTSAAPGTTPLIIVASEENKQNGAGTGTAPGTLAANAGKVYLLTSQKDLADTFGTPVFKTDANNNPIHAGEQNEFGLQAAYSYLGVSNRAYVVRANVDLAELNARAEVPSGPPDNGTLWFDTANSNFGVFQWSGNGVNIPAGQTFSNKIPLVVTDAGDISGGVPAGRIGAVGDYALVLEDKEYVLCYKNNLGSWVKVGTDDWKESLPVAETVSNPTLSGDLTITVDGNDYDVTVTGLTDLSALASAINLHTADSGVSAAPRGTVLELFAINDFEISGTAVDNLGFVPDDEAVGGYASLGTFQAPVLQISPHYTVPAWKRTSGSDYNDGKPTGSIWVKTTEPNLGARWRVKIYNSTTAAWTEVSAPIHPNSATALRSLDPTGGGINLPVNTLYVKSNLSEDTGQPLANFQIFARKNSGVTTITSVGTLSGSVTGSFTVSYTQKNSNTPTTPVTVSFIGGIDDLISAMSTQLGANARVTAAKVDGKLVIKHLDGGDIFFDDNSGNALETLFGNGVSASSATNWYEVDSTINTFVASNWSPNADITTSAVAPTTEAVDGQLWYSSIIDEVDIMVHDGNTWKGLNNEYAEASVIVSATKPGEKTTDGRKLGDIWVDTSDLENFPKIYR
jgi:hypothetical protein